MAYSRMQLEKPPSEGISIIVAKGVVYHLLGQLQPAGDNVPKYSQIYMMDNEIDQVDQQEIHFQNSYMPRKY